MQSYSMLEQFQSFLQQEQLISAEDKTLIAVSAGVDSVVLAHLFKQAGLDFAIAHCNFNLREEAKDDEQFVQHLAQELEVPFWTTSFETTQQAKLHKKSIQEIARILRYDWLQSMAAQYGFTQIATAHHLNDALETLLYNLTKGCGIRGLHGIPLRQNNIIRPLLFADKEAIRAFAKHNAIAFREDVSNASDKYARNLIRNQVVPLLKKINPSLEQTSRTTLKNIQDAETLYDFAVEQWKKRVLQKNDDHLRIQLTVLEEAPAPLSVLYEILKDYGFHPSQLSKMLEAQVGSQFFSDDYRLIRQRSSLQLTKQVTQDASKTSYQITDAKQVLSLKEGQLELLDTQAPPPQLKTDASIAFLDYEQLKFPLTLRKWQAGDYFKPLGMHGKKKKLQDYFSDQKFSRLEKEKVWILCSATGEICWIVGHRVDERYKISPKTKLALSLKWKASQIDASNLRGF